MTRSLRHRGPDHLGVWCGDRVALGHARLRIVDLHPRSDQPFRRSFPRTGPTSTLVFNGLITNHRELRADLEAEGVDFTTSGDTEVLYRALDHWGLDALPRLTGMFAFAFHQPSRRRLLLGRDRMGIKPLHLARVGHVLVFGSEIRALFASGLVDARIDPAAVHTISRFNHLLGARTAFHGIEALEAGHAAVWDHDSGAITRHRWWTPRFTEPEGTLADRTERLNGAFERALTRHLTGDVPVSVYLSGGLDSTGLAAETRKQLGPDVHTWSMGLPGTSLDEGPRAARVARELGTRHHEVPVQGPRFDDYARFVEHAELPQLWTTDLALERLAAGVSDAGHRVVLSGEGPDELFAGYDAFRLTRWRQRLTRVGASRWLPALPDRLALPGALRWAPVDLSMAKAYLRAHQGVRANDFGFHPEQVTLWELLTEPLAALAGPALAPQLGRHRAREQAWFQTDVAPHVAGLTPLQQNLWFELAVRLPSWVLRMADRMSAAHGLELRVPYLDEEVVDAALALADTDRLRGGDEKHILKRVHRGRVPSHVRRRAKQPLYTPISPWVRNFVDDPGFRHHTSAARCAEVGLFDHGALTRALAPLTGDRFHHQRHQLQSEWSVLLVLSTHLLEASATAQVAAARSVGEAA